MNLPQNIQKSDSAIARSFSQELGLNLDFKTGRKAQIQSSEHIGEKTLLMDKGNLLVVVNRQNTIVIWDIVQKCQLNSFEVTRPKVKTYYKYNEKELLFVGDAEIGVFNIDSGIYSSKVIAKKEIAAIDVSSKYGILAFYQLDKKSKEDCKVVFYKLEDFSLFNEIDCSDFITYPITEITFAQSTKTICLRDSIRAYIYDIDTFIKIHTFNIDELVFHNFFDYKYPGKMLYSTKGKSLFEYNVDNEYPTKHLFECGDIVQVSNQIILSAKYDKDSVLLTTYRLSNYEKTGQVKIKASTESIDFKKLIIGYKTISNIKHINLSGTKIIGYEFAKDKPGSLFIYNPDLSKKINIEFTASLNLKQFSNKKQIFCFEKLVYDLKKESFKRIPFEIHEDVKGNWADSGYYVSINREPDLKKPKVIFYEISTGKSIELIPQEHLSIEKDKSIREIIIEYNQEEDLWIVKCLYHGIILYDVKRNKVLKSLTLSSPSMQNKEYTNERYTIFNLDFNYALTFDKEPYKGSTLFLFNVDNQQLINEFKSQGFIHSCFFNNIDKEVYMFESIKIKESGRYDIRIHVFNYKLQLLESVSLGIEKSDASIGSNIIYLENKNHFHFSVWVNNHKKLYLFDLTKLKLTELAEIISTKIDNLILSPNEAVLIYSNDNCNGLIKLNKNFGEIPLIGNSKSSFSFSKDGKILFIGSNDKIEVYQTNPFCKICNIFIEASGYFHFEILPDETSPNGWFYTNNTEKVNVFKTKIDGSEPELLPVDNEERLAFIKHHNRKDIVMKRLFEPEKYAEFAKINASAEHMAKHDMAIELSQVENKKLENRNWNLEIGT